MRRINTPKSKREPSVDLNFTENKQIWKEEYFLDSPDSHAGQKVSKVRTCHWYSIKKWTWTEFESHRNLWEHNWLKVPETALLISTLHSQPCTFPSHCRAASIRHKTLPLADVFGLRTLIGLDKTSLELCYSLRLFLAKPSSFCLSIRSVVFALRLEVIRDVFQLLLYCFISPYIFPLINS